jgi:putative PIN family toxin of toxin-antitoxin system
MVKKVKVFLDSNVIVSGLFSERGAPHIILHLLTLNLPVISGATGAYNLMEVERTIKKKMPEMLPLYNSWLPLLDLEVVPLPSIETIRTMAGLTADKDIPVLASAIACGADYLVTGDKKDFGKLKSKDIFRTKIVSPAEFLKTISSFLAD